ncbi:MAG: PAS domain S-box protein [Nitrospira sp.]
MISTGNLSVLDLLRKRVADLSHELAERDSVLHERTRHLRVAQSLAHLGSWDWEIESGEVRCSNELYRIFGLEPGSHHMTFEIFVSALLPEEHDRVVASINDALGGKAPYDVEYRIVRPNGDVRMIHCCGEVLRDDNGKPCRMSGSVLDITERTRTEAMLRSSQEKLRQALQASGIGLWDWNTETKDMSLSDEWKRQLGYGETELHDSFETWEALLHPDDHDHAIAYVREYVRARQGEYRQEFRLRHKDGTYRWVEARASFVAEADGRRIRLLGSHTDITDRKRMEEAVRESEDRYRALVELSPSGVFVFREGQTVYANHTTAILMGANDPREILERPMFDFIHPDYHHDVRENMKRLLTGRDSVHSAERIYLKRDGTPIHVQVEAARIMWDGKPAILNLVSDVAERKQAEDALRASEELFSKAFRSSPDPMILVELDSGRWLDVNEACLTCLEYPREDVVGRKGDELEHWLPLDTQVRFIERVNREGSIRNFEVAFDTASGEHRDCLMSAERIEYNGKSCMIVLSKDITERRQAEQALWKSRQAIRALHDISSAQGQSFQERVEALLQLGCRFFDLPIGVETFVQGEALEMGPVNAPDSAFHPGMRVPLCNTYCSETLRQSGTLSFEHAGASPIWRQHPAYATLKLESYIGAVVNGLERTYGTLYFASVEPRDKRYTESERDFIQLMARWLGSELDHQSALDALRQSEERYRTLYDETPSMYFTVDGTGMIRSVNQYGAQYLGYGVEDLVGKSVTTVFFKEDRERVCAEMEAFFRHPEGVAQWEFRKVRNDGTVLWVREFARVLQSLDGEPLALIVCDDITERKHAEEALRASEERFAKAFQASPHPVVISEVDTGRLVEVNDAACQLLGYRNDEVEGHTTLELGVWYSAEERIRFVDLLKRVGSIRNMEVKLRSKHGEVRQFLLSSELIELKGKQCSVTVGDDITDRKRAEDELRRSHAFLRQVIDGDPNFIFAKDREGRFTMVNKAVADCYGTTVENLIGQSDADFNPNGEEVEFFRQKDLQVMNSLQECFIAEEKITDWSGKMRWLQSIKRPIIDDHGHAHMVLGASTDITERKRMEEMLLQRERDLSAALQERERISQDLHDGILQSLYAVGLGLETCKPLIREQPEHVAEKFLTTLDQAIGQLNQVMGEIRNFIAGLESHLMQGGDLPTALRTMVQTMCASSSATCRVRIDDAAGRHISTEHALHIINIVREGLSNSLRHSHATRITVSLRQLIGSVRLAITDNGIGFNPRSAHGVGHGLENMAARAQKVGGLFAVRAEPHRGARILLDLPKDADETSS